METHRWGTKHKFNATVTHLFSFYVLFVLKKGYVEHVISTSNEWLMSIVICIVLSTFFKDFKKVKVRHADVVITPALEHAGKHLTFTRGEFF